MAFNSGSLPCTLVIESRKSVSSSERWERRDRYSGWSSRPAFFAVSIAVVMRRRGMRLICKLDPAPSLLLQIKPHAGVCSMIASTTVHLSWLHWSVLDLQSLVLQEKLGRLAFVSQAQTHYTSIIWCGQMIHWCNLYFWWCNLYLICIGSLCCCWSLVKSTLKILVQSAIHRPPQSKNLLRGLKYDYM